MDKRSITIDNLFRLVALIHRDIEFDEKSSETANEKRLPEAAALTASLQAVSQDSSPKTDGTMDHRIFRRVSMGGLSYRIMCIPICLCPTYLLIAWRNTLLFGTIQIRSEALSTLRFACDHHLSTAIFVGPCPSFPSPRCARPFPEVKSVEVPKQTPKPPGRAYGAERVWRRRYYVSCLSRRRAC